MSENTDLLQSLMAEREALDGRIAAALESVAAEVREGQAMMTHCKDRWSLQPPSAVLPKPRKTRRDAGTSRTKTTTTSETNNDEPVALRITTHVPGEKLEPLYLEDPLLDEHGVPIRY